MRKVFLDIGSNIGLAIEEALKKEYAFDVVYGFEPVKRFYEEIIKNFKDERLFVYNFGLFREDSFMMIYGAEDCGASIFEEKNIQYGKREDELCTFRDVGEWFKLNITEDDLVYCKINVEGSECDIIERLSQTNELKKITKLLIDFDCDKIKSQKHRKSEIKIILNSSNIDYIDACNGTFPKGNTIGEKIGRFISGKNIFEN